jgi:hypothetical protein
MGRLKFGGDLLHAGDGSSRWINEKTDAFWAPDNRFHERKKKINRGYTEHRIVDHDENNISVSNQSSGRRP